MPRYVKLVMRVANAELWMGFESSEPIEEEGFIDVDTIPPAKLEAMQITRWLSLDPFDDEEEEEQGRKVN